MPGYICMITRNSAIRQESAMNQKLMRINTCFRLVCLLRLTVLPGGVALTQQPSLQNPSPMVDHTRPHRRVEQSEVMGRRFDMKSLQGARLFVGPQVNPNKPVPLIVHFHGAPWLIEVHITRHLPRAALITVQLGAGSSAYRRPFEQTELFQSLLDEASRELGLKRGWSS